MKRWTVTTSWGDVLARFESGDDACTAFCSSAFLTRVAEQYEEENQDLVVEELRLCCDGVEVVCH